MTYILRSSKILMVLVFSFFIHGLNAQEQVHEEPLEKPFVIISSSYQAKNFFKKNLKSLFNQTYQNYRIVCIDDASQDGSGKELEEQVNKQCGSRNVQVQCNKVRIGMLENIYNAVHSCKPDEIVVVVDGDDALAHPNVLAHLNKVYHGDEVWMTYGQFVSTSTEYIGECSQIPDEIIASNSFRTYPWVSSHLKTFYAGLFQKIRREDLQVAGQFFPMATDMAYTFPMLEMAGSHSRFIPEILYHYTTDNALAINQDVLELRDAYASIIRDKGSYKPLQSLQEVQQKSYLPDNTPAIQSTELSQDLNKNKHEHRVLQVNKNEKPFVIISLSYKTAQWCEACLKSAFTQKYNNFRIICIDDASPDGTGEMIRQLIAQHKQEDRVTFIQNKKRVGILSNLITAAQLCHDDEIMVLLDGDDKLVGPHVLALVNEYYKNPDVWLTYGQFIPSHPGYLGWCSKIPDDVIQDNRFRKSLFVSSHLKTFYTWLFKKIKIEDFKLGGQFFHVATDLAYMLPMLEMAGNRSRFIPHALYVYNIKNPLSEYVSMRNLVERMCRVIVNKEAYQPIFE